MLFNELKDMGKSKIQVEKNIFLKMQNYFLVQEKNYSQFWSKNISNKTPDKITIPELEPEPIVFATPKRTKGRTKKS